MKKSLTEAKYLLDVNVLVATIDVDHRHHVVARRWFDGLHKETWGTCAYTETGFIRIMVNPRIGGISIRESKDLLALLEMHPGYRYWPITARWHDLISPFQQRVVGHQQVTDAFLLGLAIRENGVLVTLDKGLRFLAGAEYSQHLRLLE